MNKIRSAFVLLFALGAMVLSDAPARAFEPNDIAWTSANHTFPLVMFTEMIAVCFRNKNAVFEHEDGNDVIRIVDGYVQVAPKNQVVNPPPGTLDPWAVVVSGSGMWDFLADSKYRRIHVPGH